MSAADDCPASDLSTLDEALLRDIDQLIADIQAIVQSGAPSRLHPIEVEIVEALRLRPRRMWCRMQVVLLRGIHAKATGVPGVPGRPGARAALSSRRRPGTT